MLPDFEHNFNDNDKETLHKMVFALKLLLFIIIAWVLWTSYLETNEQLSQDEALEETWNQILDSGEGELTIKDEYLIHGTEKQTLDSVTYDDNKWLIWYIQDNNVIHETKTDAVVYVYSDATTKSYLVKSYAYDRYDFDIMTHEVYELHLTKDDIENNLY